MNQLKLRNKVFGNFFARALIIRKNFVAEVFALGVKQNQRVIAFNLTGQFQKHVGKAVNRINRQSGRICHWGQSVKGTENITRTVN